jgi:hypothetical protein
VVIGLAHQVMLPLVAEPLAFDVPPLLDDELPLLAELPLLPLLQAASASTDATPSVVNSASFGRPRWTVGTIRMCPSPPISFFSL